MYILPPQFLPRNPTSLFPVGSLPEETAPSAVSKKEVLPFLEEGKKRSSFLRQLQALPSSSSEVLAAAGERTLVSRGGEQDSSSSRPSFLEKDKAPNVVEVGITVIAGSAGKKSSGGRREKNQTGKDKCALTSEEAWESVKKASSGRVIKQDFLEYFAHETPFGQQVPADRFLAYIQFLGNLFDVSYGMMPKGNASEKNPPQPSIGQHCFRSAVPLTMEFYATGSDGLCNNHDPKKAPKYTEENLAEETGLIIPKTHFHTFFAHVMQ